MESESVIKKTVRTVTTSGSGGSSTTVRKTVVTDLDDSLAPSKSSHRYQVYRGMSPATSNRLELKIRELEDALEAERDARMRAEKDASEFSIQLETLSERLDEADGITSAQSEITKKRDYEITKLKKDLDIMTIQQESQEASLRKRHADAINDLSEQVEHLTKLKSKSEKERQTLIIEIDNISTNYDAVLKAKAHAESKVESLDDQLRRFRAQVDDLGRQNQDLSGLKARLTQENFELQRQVQDLDSTTGALSKAKSQLQAQLDDTKSKLDEEYRQKNQLTIQFNNIQVDYDNLNARFEEESDAAANLRSQYSKLQQEMQTMKSRYEKDMIMKTEEIEDIRRKFGARIAELEDMAEQARARAAKFEKEKSRLQIEIRDITIELETSNANVAELSKRLKQADNANADLQRRVDELTHDLQNASADNQKMLGELTRLRAQNNDLQSRNDGLARDNKQLSDALREAQSQNKDLNRSVNELTSIRIQLEGERDSLASELADHRDALKDAQARLDAANAALSQLRSEMEHRLREKDDELENVRKSGQRALDELQRTIIEIETKYKSEISRLKKKYESEIREYEIQIETLSRTNAELSKNNRAMANKLKELEIALDEERRNGDEARQAVTVLERKRIALSTELEDVRSLLETAERARKNAENELHDAGSRINELTISITSLTGDKRRMEADIAAMHSDLDEALNARRASDERADRLQMQVNGLAGELAQEQENYKNAESLRKQLEIEIREITVRLEEAEAFAQREGKRMVAKLQSRLRDLESELEVEQRRARELATANRKIERQLQEFRLTYEEEHRTNTELSDTCNTLSIRVKTLRRQLEEAEEVVTITMNKYRKSQQMLEEADHRADMAERSVSLRTRGRSMSVTREITKVVRV